MTKDKVRTTKDDQTGEGLWLLQHPVLPLFRMVQFLYLSGPFAGVEEVIAQFSEPIETQFARYEEPAAIMAPYLPLMKDIEPLKNTEKQAIPLIVDGHDAPLNRFTAMESWVSQLILVKIKDKWDRVRTLPC